MYAELTGVTKRYGGETVLNDLTRRLEGVTVLMGPSGRGFSQFGCNRSGDSTQRFHDRCRYDRRIAGHHKHGHCLADGAAYAQNDT